MTYMATCNTSTCDKFDCQVNQNQPAQSEVRRVHFVGTRRTSVRIDIFSPKDHTHLLMLGRENPTVKELPVTVTLPTQVAPGGYLVCHEIITLQCPSAAPRSTNPARESSSAARRPVPTIRPCPFWARTTTTTRASATRACTITLWTFSLARPCPTPPHYPVGLDLMWVQAHRLRQRAQATQGNKLMSTSESGPNAQPTSSPSSSKAICTFNKRGTSLMRRAMGISQHKHRVGFMRVIRGAFQCS